VAQAIVEVETQGKCHLGGKSGERGCFQFMPGTWEHWSVRFFGHVASMTPENEYAVALYKIQKHIDEGYGDSQIALIWNQGNPSKCKSGTNKHGVAYNSCEYVQKFLVAMR